MIASLLEIYSWWIAQIPHIFLSSGIYMQDKNNCDRFVNFVLPIYVMLEENKNQTTVNL